MNRYQIAGSILLFYAVILTAWALLCRRGKAEPKPRLTTVPRNMQGLRPARADFEKTYHVRLKPRQRGQALVEFALLMPVAMLAFLAALDVGVMVSAANNVTYAAIQTAQCAATSCPDPVGYGTTVASQLGMNPASLTVTSSCTATQCTATVHCVYKPFGPFPAQTLTRSATAVLKAS